jgi:hypothetical protein
MSAPLPPKKPYTPPRLRYLGTVAELTHAPGSLPDTEPVTFIAGKRAP